jgi:transposase
MVAGTFIQQVGATRQRRSIAKKRKIVEQTMRPGASVAQVAQQHGVKTNQVFYWRNLYRQGRLGEESTGSISLLPVQVAEATASKIVELEANSPWCKWSSLRFAAAVNR